MNREQSTADPDMARTSRWLAFGLLILFGCGVLWALWVATKPPLLADEAPPTPICVMTSAPSETATPSTPPSASPTTRPTRRPTTSPTRRTTPRPQASQTRAPQTPKPPQVTRVFCPDGEIEYPSQPRGAFDASERIIGILAVVGPLITSVIGFFFGARAGSSEGRELATRARARTDSLKAAADAEADLPKILERARQIAPEAWEK